MPSQTARRSYSGPAFLERGFRPFFLGAAVFAGIAVPLWVFLLSTPLAAGALLWHRHEMIFGYLGAVLAGFLLTAIPNWTGRLPVAGIGLALLFVLWCAGRLAMAFAAAHAPLAALIDIIFPLVLAALIWREVLAGGNWRNLPICGLVTLFALANLLFHLESLSYIATDYAQRLALAVAAMLIALVGGRVVPSFTRNWLAKRGSEQFPASFGVFDKAALLAAGVALVAWVAAPAGTGSGAFLILAGILHAVRLARWRGWCTGAEPLVLVLHTSYGWLVVSFFLMGLAVLWPDRVNPSAAVHALTSGAIGSMTVAVMSRATLGHSGRPLTANRITSGIYLLIGLGALLRVAASLLPGLYDALISISGVAWSGGFLLFVLGYGPMLLGRRAGA